MKATISRLAARAVFGRPVRLQLPPPLPAKEAPAPDIVGEARHTAARFSARLLELAAARAAFDAAIDTERATVNIDLAGLVMRGEPLPDFGDTAAARSRAETRLRALWQLANQEAPLAARACQTVKADAVTQATTARADALSWVVDQLPPGVFSDPLEVARLAKLPRHAARALETVESAPSLRVVKAELFGVRLPGYRTAPTAATPRDWTQPDEFSPATASQGIDRLLALHAEAIRFRCLIATDPGNARFEC